MRLRIYNNQTNESEKNQRRRREEGQTSGLGGPGASWCWSLLGKCEVGGGRMAILRGAGAVQLEDLGPPSVGTK